MRSRLLVGAFVVLSGLPLGAVERDLVVWVEPSAKKVFQDSPPGSLAEIRLSAARGEWESAEVVLRAETGCRLVRIEVDPGPKRSDGARIPREAIELRRVAYVPVAFAGKAWPDPLVPIRGPVEVRGGENAPVLVTVRVPRGAEPGEYRGEVVLRWERPAGEAAGCEPSSSEARIPLAIRVHPFEIPERPSAKTAFGISWDLALKFEGIAPGTPEARAMAERYYRMLLEHRISAYEIPCDILDPEAERYLDDPAVTSFLIPYRDDVAWMRARVERCREKGWLDRAYLYPRDEPVSEADYASLRACVERIRSIDPKLRIVSPFYRAAADGRSAYDALDGLVTIWCAVSAYFEPPRMEEKRRKGEEVWWYVCCGPGRPYANLHLTMDAIDHRVLPWQMFRFRVEGFLYWSTTYWNPAAIENPWTSMVTVPEINRELAGDGSLFYPGRLPSGERVSDGPVASLRLLVLRDGFEDLEYLALLEKEAGREAADELAGRVARDLTHFSKDPAELERVREEIAAKIVEARSKGGRAQGAAAASLPISSAESASR